MEVVELAVEDPCADWCAAESMYACFCPFWDAVWDWDLRVPSDCDVLPALAEDEEESGGDGRREAPLPSVGPALIVVYLGEDLCREEE